MDKDLAIKVENVSKTFRIPHEKITTIRGAFVNALRSKGYEEFRALDDVSFEVKKGEFFGIIGRNGSGKSTLLKILAGIYQPDKKGEIHVGGRISPFLELGIGFNPELSGRDNIYLNAAVLGLTHKQINKKFDDIVEFSELRRFIDQKVKNYSSGMQVRLAFSVAIHANRDILLMDEVLAVGDSNFQSKCLEEFNKYKDMGKTVILVTHDIATVQRYCDRAMLLRNGKIEMTGKSEKVGSKYIEQNMSDEERRIFDEEKRQILKSEKEVKQKQQTKKERKQQGEKRNKVVEIAKVEFLDGDGNKKNVFQTGEDLSIRIYFRRKEDIKVLNFGIAIFDQENNSLFATDTFLDKIDTSQMMRNGYFQINYKNIPLRTNTYYVQLGIWGEIPAFNYDYMLKSKIFKIFSNDQYIGMINIDHSWN